MIHIEGSKDVLKEFCEVRAVLAKGLSKGPRPRLVGDEALAARQLLEIARELVILVVRH